MTDIKTFALDLAERAAWTFVQAFAGAVVGLSQVTSLDDVKSAALAGLGAGVAAVASLVKGVIAGLRTGSASSSLKVTEAATAAAPLVVTDPTTPVQVNDPAEPAAAP